MDHGSVQTGTDVASGAGTAARESLAPTSPPTRRVAPEEFRSVPIFADLPDAELAWIASRADIVELEPGGVLFSAGDPAQWMFVGLEGTVHARRDQLGAAAPLYVFGPGDVGGTIPFSRMVTFAGTGRAVTRARVARFGKPYFDELLRRVPVLAPRFAALLADRVRDATRRDAQFEKLSALGRLSAGVAHELNNPAAAASRAAAASLVRLARRGAAAAAVVEAGLSRDTLAALDAVRASVVDRIAYVPAADAQAAAREMLTRGDREDALAAWLRAAGVPEAAERAATFIDAGLDDRALADALASVPPAAHSAALVWLESLVCDSMLLTTVRHAAARVADLVDAMRTYTQMDRARSADEVDVHAGLESVLALAAPQNVGVAIVREYARALPRVPGYPAELNQAWTALLDNALDAAGARSDGAGSVTVRTAVEDGAVTVEFRDNGPGVPPDLQDRIWEPFFTTKEVGRGAGLGLDIARRVLVDQHAGQLTLESRPGDTRVVARLPLTSMGTIGA
jgi:signal transduction histidine kinase